MCRSSAISSRILVPVFSIAVMFGCGGAEPEAETDDALQITQFSASPISIEAGQSTILSWKTSGATAVALESDKDGAIDLAGASASAGSVEVWPTSTTRYELKATGAGGESVRSTARVTVGKPDAPSVVFEAKDPTLDYGASTELWWRTERAAHVTITAGEEIVFDEDMPSGSIAVSPTTSTEYRILATGLGGEDSKAVVVTVAPVISSFSSSVEHAPPGAVVTVRWETRGAERVVLSSPEGFEYVAAEDEREQGEVEAPVGVSGRFLLHASRGPLEVDSRVELTVDTEPMVVAFLSTPPAVTESGTVVLSWKALNTQFVSIEADPGGYVVLQQPAESAAELDLAGATTFRLTAAGVDGSSVSKTLVVPSVPVPTIESFIALPARVGEGEEVRLSWTTQDAVRVEIEGIATPEPLPANGSVRAPIGADSTFVLRAFNAAEYPVESAIDVTVGPPVVLSFETSAGKVHAGAPLTFSWANLGGSSLQVLGPSGAMPGCTTTDPAVIASGTCTANAPVSDGEVLFTLQVTNGAMESTSEARPVVVRDGPILDRFETADTIVNQGDPIRLSWVVGPDRQGEAPVLELRDDLGTVYPIGDPALGKATIEIQDPGLRKLRLAASTSHGTPDLAEVEVEVVALPTVSFTADEPFYDPTTGIPVLLTWATTGAVSIAIYQLDASGDPILPAMGEYVGGRAAGGSIQVTPNGPKDYRAVAVNSLGGTATANAHVDAPVFDIVSFTASPDVLPAGGGTTTLAWQTVGATSVTLDIPQTMIMTPGTPAFMDISGSPTKRTLPSDSCNSGYSDEECPVLTFPSGFTFPFDGTPRTQARVYMNGFISFDIARTGDSWTNTAIPSTSSPYVHLAPFWQDLFPGSPMIWDDGSDGRGRYVVVQWPHFTDFTTDLNFQVIMWEDGYFEYRYGTMSPGSDARGAWATIGYQNYTGTSGVLIGYQTDIPTLPNSGYSFAVPTLAVNGTRQVSTSSTRTYTLTAHGPGGLMTTRTISVTVGP